MRDKEIAVLEGQIEALNQEKRRSWGSLLGLFQKENVGKFDEEMAELHQKHNPNNFFTLVARCLSNFQLIQ